MTQETTLKHIAIIPDGNRRWAKAQGLAEVKGHEKGIEVFFALLKELKEFPISAISFWAFSTDNWKRSEIEKKFLFAMLEEKISKVSQRVQEENLRFRWVGRRDQVAASLREGLEKLEQETKNNTGVILQLCFDYGGREEILRAVNKAIKKGKEVTEEEFSELLDTAGVPDPDLIIRTSGEHRLSGFFSWQSKHSELYFCDKFFPDFTVEDFRSAINDFSERSRRFGGN